MSEVYSSFHLPHFFLSTTCILWNLLLQIIQSMKLKDISAHFNQQNVILCKSCCQQEIMPKEKWKNQNSFYPEKINYSLLLCCACRQNGNSKTSPSVDKIKIDFLIQETKWYLAEKYQHYEGQLRCWVRRIFPALYTFHCFCCVSEMAPEILIHCSKIFSDGLKYRKTGWAKEKHGYCFIFQLMNGLDCSAGDCPMLSGQCSPVTDAPHGFVPQLWPPSIFLHCEAFILLLLSVLLLLLQSLFFQQSSLHLGVPDCPAPWWLAPCDPGLQSLKLCRSKQRLVSLNALQLLSITGLKPVSTSQQQKGLFYWSTPATGFLPGPLLMPSETHLGKTFGFSKDGVKIGPSEKKITGRQ